jgi:hypothetical protein
VLLSFAYILHLHPRRVRINKQSLPTQAKNEYGSIKERNLKFSGFVRFHFVQPNLLSRYKITSTIKNLPGMRRLLEQIFSYRLILRN